MGKKQVAPKAEKPAPAQKAPEVQKTLEAPKKEKKEGTNVAIVRLLPDDVDIDLVKLKERITNILLYDIVDKDKNHKVCQLLLCKEEPIAFGLKSLNMQISMPEFMAGGTEPVEEALSKLEGVQRVEVGIVTRL